VVVFGDFQYRIETTWKLTAFAEDEALREIAEQSKSRCKQVAKTNFRTRAEYDKPPA